MFKIYIIMPHDPPLYTEAQIRQIAQENAVPNYDTREIHELGMFLYNNDIITQEMLQARQDYYRANGSFPPLSPP